jgi:hypothetical protein
MKRKTLKSYCDHPQSYADGQGTPEPCEVIKLCACGDNWYCPVCGWEGHRKCECGVITLGNFARVFEMLGWRKWEDVEQEIMEGLCDT